MGKFTVFLQKLNSILKVFGKYAKRMCKALISKIRKLGSVFMGLSAFFKSLIIGSAFLVIVLLTVLIFVLTSNTAGRRRRIKVQVQEIEQEAEETPGIELTLREREDLVYRLLMEAGFTEEAVCGIMGNISVECTNFEPTLEGNNNMTYGLFQWNDVGQRRTRLMEWCEENSYSYESIEGQIAYAIYEMEGGDSIACRLENFLKTTHDAYTASMEFTVGFERCVCNNTEEMAYTGSIYPEYAGSHYQSMFTRISRSLNYYTRYVSNKEGEKVMSSTPAPTQSPTAAPESLVERFIKQIK